MSLLKRSFHFECSKNLFLLPQKDWPEGYQLANEMNFKFPAFSPIPLESIVPNCSPEGITLISQLLDWNPSKRPTSSSVFRCPYFTKDPPVAALSSGTTNNVINSNRNTSISSIPRANMVKGQEYTSSSNNNIQSITGSSFKSSIPVAQSDFNLQSHFKSPPAKDVKGDGALKPSATYSDLSISSKVDNLNNGHIDDVSKVNSIFKPIHGSLNDISQESIGRKSSFFANSSSVNSARGSASNNAKFMSSSEHSNDGQGHKSSVLNDPRSKGLLFSPEATFVQKENRRDSTKQQRILQDFLTGDSIINSNHERKENSVPINGLMMDPLDGDEFTGNTKSVTSPTSPISKYFGPTGHTESRDPFSQNTSTDSISNISAKQMYMSRSRYITGQPYKSYPGQVNNSHPGSNQSNSSRSAGELTLDTWG